MPKETNTCSGTPGNEATERTDSQRKGSKLKRKGWVGRTASEFAVGLTISTALDLSRDEGDFENSWKRKTKRLDGPAVEQRNRSYLPKAGYSERTSVFVCFPLRTRTKPDDTELIRTTTNQPVKFRVSAEARRLVFPLGFVRISS